MTRISRAALAMIVVAAMAGDGDSLVPRMKAKGITHLNTSKIVLYGSEADVGSGVQVEVVEHFLIQRIWDAIYQSRPERVWYASGYRKAVFYADSDPNKPVLTLWVNASDACSIGKQKERFRCPRLNELVIKLLELAKAKQADTDR